LHHPGLEISVLQNREGSPLSLLLNFSSSSNVLKLRLENPSKDYLMRWGWKILVTGEGDRKVQEKNK